MFSRRPLQTGTNEVDQMALLHDGALDRTSYTTGPMFSAGRPIALQLKAGEQIIVKQDFKSDTSRMFAQQWLQAGWLGVVVKVQEDGAYLKFAQTGDEWVENANLAAYVDKVERIPAGQRVRVKKDFYSDSPTKILLRTGWIGLLKEVTTEGAWIDFPQVTELQWVENMNLALFVEKVSAYHEHKEEDGFSLWASMASFAGESSKVSNIQTVEHADKLWWMRPCCLGLCSLAMLVPLLVVGVLGTDIVRLNTRSDSGNDLMSPMPMFGKPSSNNDLIASASAPSLASCPAPVADVVFGEQHYDEWKIVTPGEIFKVQLPDMKETSLRWDPEGMSREAEISVVGASSGTSDGEDTFVMYNDLMVKPDFRHPESVYWNLGNRQQQRLALHLIPAARTLVYGWSERDKTLTVVPPLSLKVMLPNPHLSTSEACCPDMTWLFQSISGKSVDRVQLAKSYPTSGTCSFFIYDIAVQEDFVGPVILKWIHVNSKKQHLTLTAPEEKETLTFSAGETSILRASGIEGVELGKFGAEWSDFQLEEGFTVSLRLQTAPPPPKVNYDCTTGALDFEQNWTPARQEWCCINKFIACPSTPRPAYDCVEGFQNFALLWSKNQITWCCVYQHVACPPTTTTTPPPHFDYFALYDGEVGALNLLDRSLTVVGSDIIGVDCGAVSDDIYRIILDKVVSNNLGNVGPDAGPEGIVYNAHGIYWDEDAKARQMAPLVVTIHARSPYEPYDKNLNGLAGEFGQITQPAGRSINVSVTFKTSSGDPVDYHGKRVSMSIYDMDTGTQGAGVEFVRASHFVKTKLNNPTTLEEIPLSDHEAEFRATIYGTGADNPTDPDSLTAEQKSKAVVFEYSEPRTVRLTIGSSPLYDNGWGPRFTMMYFTDGLDCNSGKIGYIVRRATCMPTVDDILQKRDPCRSSASYADSIDHDISHIKTEVNVPVIEPAEDVWSPME